MIVPTNPPDDEWKKEWERLMREHHARVESHVEKLVEQGYLLCDLVREEEIVQRDGKLVLETRIVPNRDPGRVLTTNN